ncbi:MAG: glycosyltransferase [Candidatus Omnitrophica bacterium]|nr:glycosyltransferase [Candidatus Omnitrophota bacterium]
MKVAAVVLTHNYTAGVTAVLEDLVNQTRKPDEIIVIDNASTDKTEQVVRETFPQVHYVKLESNTGCAGGFYEGLRVGVEYGDFIWTLDDDVKLYHDTLSNLLEGLTQVAHLGAIGAVRCVIKRKGGHLFKKMNGFAWRGTLINAESVKKIGLPIKEYFLYGCDAEYSLRLLKAGYSMFYIQDSYMQFSRDERDSHRLFGIQTDYYFEPHRLYYGFRNEIDLHIRYKEVIKMLRLIGYVIKVVICLLLWGRGQRWEKIKAVGNGVMDGLRSKLGKNDKYLPQSEILSRHENCS